MTQRLSALAIAAGLSLSVLPAAQAATAQMSLTGFTFELIDLAPDDGVAPSINFVRTESNSMNAYTRSSLNRVYTEHHDFRWPSLGSDHWLGDVSLTSAVTGASFSGSGTPTSWQMSIEASVSPDGASTDWSIASFSAGVWRTFELSAHTALVIRGEYAMEGATADRSGPGAAPFEHGSGSVLLQADLGGLGDQFQLSKGFGLSNFDSRGLPGYEAGRSFETTLTNASTSSASGRFFLHFRGEVSSFTRAQPIPEPQTAGLILAGLAGLGVSAWRRRA